MNNADAVGVSLLGFLYPLQDSTAALSLASNSCSITFIMESRSQFSLVSLLTIRLMSERIFFIKIDDSKLPYEDDVTPRDFKQRSATQPCHSFRSAIKSLDGVTMSSPRSASMCLVIWLCLFPNLFFRIATASV